jgi:hypothetical protein
MCISISKHLNNQYRIRNQQLIIVNSGGQKFPVNSFFFPYIYIYIYIDLTVIVILTLQELSPTSDTALVKSLMNLMDSLMDEFKDEAKISQMEDRETMSWLEVSALLKFVTTDGLLHSTNIPYWLHSIKDSHTYIDCTVHVIPLGKSCIKQ